MKLVKSQTSVSHNEKAVVDGFRRGERANIQRLAAETAEQTEAANIRFNAHITELRSELDRTTKENKEAKAIATCVSCLNIDCSADAWCRELAGELVRLRRLMREPKRISLDDATGHSRPGSPTT